MSQIQHLKIFLALSILFLAGSAEIQAQKDHSHPGNFYTIEKEFENSRVDGKK